MTQSSPQHSRPMDEPGSPIPEPTYAERARTLMQVGTVGSLSTLSQKHPGWPFGSVMPYALDERGQPFFLISTMAMHTKNISGDPKASLLITQPGVTGDPLGAARVTLMGTVQRLPKEDSSQHRDLYLTKFDNATYWVDFTDFGFYAMTVSDVYYVGGFGAMGWVASEEYQHASVDPLVDIGPSLMESLNQQSRKTLIRIAQQHGYPDIQDARITAVDYLGLHLRLQSEDRVQGARIAFPSPASSADDVRIFIHQMDQKA